MHLSPRLIRLAALGTTGGVGLIAVLYAVAAGLADAEHKKILAVMLLAGFWGLLVGAALIGMRAGAPEMVTRFHRKSPE